MKRTHSFVSAVAAALLLAGGLVSCDQSPIFYNISNEVAQPDALVVGSPTPVVAYDSKAWVANGLLFYKDGSSAWTKATPPAAGIHALAATPSALFAYSIVDSSDGNSSTRGLYASATPIPTSAASWSAVALDASAQDYPELDSSLFVANDTLYVGSHVDLGEDYGDARYQYALLEYSGGVLTKVAGPYDTPVVAVVYDGSTYTYVATGSSGIYQSGDSYASAISDTAPSGYQLLNMIAVGAKLLAVGNDIYGSDEYLWLANTSAGSSTTFLKSDRSVEFTGGLDLYDSNSDGTPELLFIGDTTGYREVTLSSGEISYTTPGDIILNDPGDLSESPVDDQNQYASSLETATVMSLSYVDPGSGTKELYASTNEDGLWVLDESADEWVVVD